MSKNPLVAAVTHEAVIELLRCAADGITIDREDMPSLLRAAEELDLDAAVSRAAVVALSETDPTWGVDDVDDDGDNNAGFRRCLLETAWRLENGDRFEHEADVS